jgi:hypothetical protein
MYEKTACQFQIKCITDDYLVICKSVQLLATHLHLIQTNLQESKLLKTHMYRHKVIENAKPIKAWIVLQLFIDLGLMK